MYAVLLWMTSACMITACATSVKLNSEPEQASILKDWRGDYPVSELRRLPEGQRSSRIGYLGSRQQFTDIWQIFKPGDRVPEVDFNQHIVIFSRNVKFYNRTDIARVILKEGVAQILAVETMSALPIEDKVAMALAVIPRTGVKCLTAGNEQILVDVDGQYSVSNPLNTVFTIEGYAIFLKDGFFEEEIGPDSATKIRTFISGKPVYGDLDGDGDKDAAVLLVHDPGGSGTFYYVAVAMRESCDYQGTNGVFLGDRIVPESLDIRNGIVIARYAIRQSDEPMSTAPSIRRTLYMTMVKKKLTILPPTEAKKRL